MYVRCMESGGSSKGMEVQLETCLCQPEWKDYHTVGLFLFYLVDVVADDTEWGNA